jgi:putative endonuclease
MTPYFIYLLECSDGSFYTGQTRSLALRLRQHNAGEGGSYTRIRTPVELVYTEAHVTRAEAMRKEREIKKLSRKEKRELITGSCYVS